MNRCVRAVSGCLVMCLVVLSFVVPCVAEPSRPFLVKISRSHPDADQILRERDIPVNYKLAEWYIAEAANTDIESLQSKGIECAVLDPEAWTHPYYLISRPQQRPLGEIPGAVRIVYHSQTEAIVKISGNQLFDLAGAGFQLTRLFQRPLPLVDQSAVKSVSFRETVRSADVVDALVNQVSAVTIRSYVQHLQDYETRLWASEPIWPASQWIYDLFVDLGYTDVVFEEFTVSGDDYVWYQPGHDVQVRNVIATKRGALYPDSVYIIGGHYDSIVIDGGVTDPYVWAPGADDNASGAVAAIEAARILANVDLDCTVKFACWTAEEIGLYGAYYYVDQAHKRGENIALYMNFDMIANVDVNDPVRDVTIYRDGPSRPYADLMEDMADQYTTLVPVQRNAGGGSDHVPFMQYGYHIVYGEEADFSPNWHQPTDVTDNMDFQYLAEVIKAALGTLVTLAGPPESLNDPVILFESYDMDDGQGAGTGNGNGYFDGGETVLVSPTLHNYGTMQVSEVNGTLSTDDPYVTVLTSTQGFGTIPGGGSAASQGPFRFTLSQDVPNGRTVLFSLEGTASEGRQWTTYFSIKVEEPDMIYRTYTFTESAGDGDGILDPGETVDIFLELENTGLRTASGISGTITADDTDVSITDNTAVFSDAEMDGMSSNEGDAFIFYLNGEAEPHAVVFTLHLSEGQGYYQTDRSFRLLVGQGTVLLVADDEEVNNQDYYTEALSYLGIPYDVEDAQSLARSLSGDLAEYAEVIWFTGYAQANTLEPADRDALQTYLDNGARLFISGSMLGYDIGNTSFYQHYLHGKFVSFMTLLYHLQDAPGNPVMGDMAITLAEEGPNAQGFAGETNPVSPAVSIFNYDRTAEEGPGIIKSSGSGALAVETSEYKVVYISFGLEGVEPMEDRAQILIDALTWFKTPGVDKGDVDGNGTTNIIDAIVAVNFVLGTDTPSADELTRTDMNYDDTINVLDVIGVVNAVLGSAR